MVLRKEKEAGLGESRNPKTRGCTEFITIGNPKLTIPAVKKNWGKGGGARP